MRRRTEEYVIEPFVAGVGGDLRRAGAAGWSVISLPPIEIVPAEGGVRLHRQISGQIDPGDLSRAILLTSARKSWIRRSGASALSCSGYSRSDFIVSGKGLIYLETNTLPGLTKASLYPKALKAQGIEFADFLHHLIALAERRTRQ